MPSKLIRVLIVLGLIAAAVSYLFYFNPTTITFSLGGTRQWQSPLALFVIIIFCLGGAFAALLAIVFNLRRAIDDQRQRWRDRTWKRHLEMLVSGREKLAAHEFQAARQTFERMVSEDSDNIIARVMLADTIASQGDARAALQVLDAARLTQKKNLELLFAGAELNEELGNLTAAYDNVALVLQSAPDNRFAHELAADYARKLSRYDAAIAHINTLLRLAPKERYETLQEQLADLELARVKHDSAADPVALKRSIENLLRKHRDYPPALSELAYLEHSHRRDESAAKLWTKAFHNSGDTKYLKSLAGMWLRASNPALAVSSVRAAVEARERNASSDPRGRIFLISLLLRLEMTDQAEADLRALEQISLDESLTAAAALLRANVLNRRGRFDEALAELSRAVPGAYGEFDLEDLFNSDNAGKIWSRDQHRNGGQNPSPRLSVP